MPSFKQILAGDLISKSGVDMRRKPGKICAALKKAGLDNGWISSIHPDEFVCGISGFENIGFSMEIDDREVSININYLITGERIVQVSRHYDSYLYPYIENTTIINYFVSDKAFVVYWNRYCFLYLIKNFGGPKTCLIGMEGYPMGGYSRTSLITQQGIKDITAINHVVGTHHLGVYKGIRYKPLIYCNGESIESPYNVYYGNFKLGDNVDNELLIPLTFTSDMYYIGIS